MKTKKKRVLWIDDDPGRERDAKNICDTQLEVEFVSTGLDHLRPRALAKYDLLLVDYRLEKSSEALRGPAVVGRLRSVDDETPAYLVSSESAAKRALFSGLTWFEEALSPADVQNLAYIRMRLKADIEGYRSIRKVKRRANVVGAITSLLEVPEASKDSVLEAIPASVKASLVRSGNATEASGAAEVSGRLGFARWIRRVLLQKPGPLLPALHAATRVGMKPTRLQKARIFKDCIYSGIFADDDNPRWWAACLDEVVFAEQQRKNLEMGLPWEIGPSLFGLSKHEQPRCAVCRELFPETVARDADAPDREAAVHQRHSSPDPNRDFTPFFVEERLFQEGD